MSTVRSRAVKISRCAAALLFLMLLLPLNRGASQERGEPATVRSIGVILPLSGELAKFGEKVRLGIELAAREFGTGIRIVFEDGEASKAKALSAYQKLARIDGARYFIGPFGPDQTFVVSSSAERDKALLLSVSLCDDRFRTLPRVFCIYPSQKEQLRPLLSLFKARFSSDARRIALLIEEVDAAAPYGALLQGYAQETGAAVVSDISFPHDATDFRAYLLRIKRQSPDLLVVGAMSPASVARAFRQAREIGFTPRFRWYLSEEDARFFADNRDVLEGAYAVGAPTLEPAFVEEFKTAFGYAPDLYHALGFDAARALLTALRQEHFPEDTKKIVEALPAASPSSKSAVRGFSFSSERFVSLALSVKQFHNGALVDIERGE